MDNKEMKEKLHERALITCVIMLAVCVIFKLFGADWFDLNTEIPMLQRADEIIMNSAILSFIITLIFKVANGILVCSIMTKDILSVFRKIYYIAIVAIISMVMNYSAINSMIIFIYDFICLIVVSKIISKVNIIECFAVMILNAIYQAISLYLRNIAIEPHIYGFLVYSLMSFDYYIMLAITYLYLKKGDNTLCGVADAFYSSLRKRLLKTHTANSSPSLDKGADHE